MGDLACNGQSCAAMFVRRCLALRRLTRHGAHPRLPLVPPFTTFQPASTPSSSPQAFPSRRRPLSSSAAESADESIVGERNGLDPAYPWRFEGRFVLRPSLVRARPDDGARRSLLLGALGNYSLGGSVVLEYDVSPVGPYREYVTVGGDVSLGKYGFGTGRWGAAMNLFGVVYVSNRIGGEVTRHVWGCPSRLADIELVEEGPALVDGPDVRVENDDSIRGRRRMKFTMFGWESVRVACKGGGDPEKRYGTITVRWTPQPWKDEGSTGERPLQQKIRLSAGSVRLKRCGRLHSEATSRKGEMPLGWALVVDNALIEIGERIHQ